VHRKPGSHYLLFGSGIVVEAKEKIKERLGRSPACADAAAVALKRRREFRFDIA
jgi:hypothetical protein